MNYTIECYSKTTGACVGVLNLDPRDYLDYSTAEEAEEALVLNTPCPELPEYDDYDYSTPDSDEVEFDIPDEFWREWEEIKNIKI